MPVDRAAVSRMFQPGGEVFRYVDGLAARVHAAEVALNPVDTGRSQSSWRTAYQTGEFSVTFSVYNNTEYVAYIRRKGTREERGAFICQAAARVFQAAGIPYRCIP